MRPRLPSVPRWVMPLLYAAVAVAFLLFALYVASQLVMLDNKADSSASRIDQAERDRDALAEVNAAQDRALAEANRNLRKVGEAPVVVPKPAEVAGTPGAQGATGATGATGPRGPRGFDGPTGKAGDSGLPGADGEAGLTGADGANGSAGPKGEQGPKGDAGPQGVRGEQGTQGDPGRDGANGADSTTPGPAGPAGPQGIPGVVNVVTSPECLDLAPNMSVSLAYDAARQTLTLVCA